MAYSYVNFTGNGSTTVFTVSFPYLSNTHVNVTVDGAPAVAGVDYTWPTEFTIQFGVAPAVGAAISIQRNTPRDVRMVDFQDASVLTEAALDLDSDQLMYIVQEAYDSTGTTAAVQEAVDAAVAAAGSATAADASADAAAATAAGLAQLYHRGSWAAATLYYQDNLVIYGGSSYIALAQHTSSSNFATDEVMMWQLVASKGDQGLPGVDGGGAGDTNSEVDVTDYGAVADFVAGPGSTKASGTDNTTAFNAAIATGRPIYVPAGDYWVSNATTRYNLQWVKMYGPGVLWGNTNVGYTRLGKTLPIGTNRSHELGSVGGLHVGAEDGGFGMRQWMGHHNWMQFQPAKYGAPNQVQIYPSVWNCTATPQSPDRLNALYGTFDSSVLRVGDYIGWNGKLYVVASIPSSAYITVTKAFVGGSPAWATDATLEKPCFKAYETADGTCNTNGTLVTFVDGEQFPYGYSGDHQYIIINGVKYTVTTGPEGGTANTLTLSTSAGVQNNVSFHYERQYAPWSYVSLLRLQGIAGGKESVAVFSVNTRNEVLIGAAATHPQLVGNMRIEAPRIRIGGYEKYPWDGTDDRYGIEVVAPAADESFGAHFVRLGGYDGREAVKVVSWNAHTDHITMYGSVAGVNPGPTIAAEGTTANLDLMVNAKGLGNVRVGPMVSIGNGTLIDRPYENVVATGGVDGWPDRTTPETSLLKIGLGSAASPRVCTFGDAPAGIFMQNYVKPNFTGDPFAYYVGGANMDTIVQGGIGGCTGLSATVYKMPGTYTGDLGVVGGRIGVDARDATHYGGILTGFWAFTHGDRNSTSGIAPGIEINSFCNQSWSPSANYSADPFHTNGKRSVMGLLINNYQNAVDEYGGASGDYQNTFGIALASLGPGGVGGRGFGYQTGLYLSDCSKENIRIRGGVYGSSLKSDYGIKFEGNAMNVAGIYLGPNKFNWGTGAGAGAASNEGDMLYNEVTNILYFNQGGTVRETMFADAPGTSASYTGDRKIPVSINGTTYYLLAATTA